MGKRAIDRKTKTKDTHTQTTTAKYIEGICASPFSWSDVKKKKSTNNIDHGDELNADKSI